MFNFGKLFGRGGAAVIDEPAPSEEEVAEATIASDQELKRQVEDLVKEAEDKPVPERPANVANVFVVNKSGEKVPLDEHKERMTKEDKQKIAEVQQSIAAEKLSDLSVETPSVESRSKDFTEEEKKSFRHLDPDKVPFGGPKIKSKLDGMSDDDLIEFYLKSINKNKKPEPEAEVAETASEPTLAKAEAEIPEQQKDSAPQFGRTPKKVERSYAPKDEELETERAYQAWQKEAKVKSDPRRRSEPTLAKAEAEIPEQQKDSAPQFGRTPKKVERSYAPKDEELETERAYQAWQKEAKVKSDPRRRSEPTLAKAEAETPEQQKEVEVIAEDLSPEAVFEVLSIPPATVEEGGEREKKNESFWQKTKSVLGNPKVQSQIFKTGVSSVASILGLKAIYDVPAYLKQRYAVRGNILGVGKGGGLEGSVEDLLEASQMRKAETNSKLEDNNKGLTMEAIRDLDKRLAMTKEGSQKNSEQRKMIAKLLWENRHRDQQTSEQRKEEMENILDNYTTTKVTGIQAAREALNTACVGIGALPLRGVTYGGLAFFEKMEEMRREARIEAKEKGVEAEKITLGKVFSRGLKETYEGIFLKTGKNRIEKGVAAAKSWGSVARFAGIALGLGGGGQAYGASLDNVLDAFSGKISAGDVGQNLFNNAEKYFKFIPHLNVGAVQAETLTAQSAPAIDQPEAVLTKPEVTASFNESDVLVKASAPNEFFGGKTIWNEAENQISNLRGQADISPQDIDRVKDLIVANPENYGLPADADLDNLTPDQLKEVDWQGAMKDARIGEGAVAGSIKNLDQALGKNNGEGVISMAKKIDITPTTETVVELGSPQDVEAFLAEPGHKETLQTLSAKAERFFDPKVPQAERNAIGADMTAMKAALEKELGARMGFDLDGDITLHYPDGHSMKVFEGDGRNFVTEKFLADSPVAQEEAPAAFVQTEEMKELAEAERSIKNFMEPAENEVKVRDLAQLLEDRDKHLLKGRFDRQIEALTREIEKATGAKVVIGEGHDIFLKASTGGTYKILDNATGHVVDTRVPLMAELERKGPSMDDILEKKNEEMIAAASRISKPEMPIAETVQGDVDSDFSEVAKADDFDDIKKKLQSENASWMIKKISDAHKIGSEEAENLSYRDIMGQAKILEKVLEGGKFDLVANDQGTVFVKLPNADGYRMIFNGVKNGGSFVDDDNIYRTTEVYEIGPINTDKADKQMADLEANNKIVSEKLKGMMTTEEEIRKATPPIRISAIDNKTGEVLSSVVAGGEGENIPASSIGNSSSKVPDELDFGRAFEEEPAKPLVENAAEGIPVSDVKIEDVQPPVVEAPVAVPTEAIIETAPVQEAVAIVSPEAFKALDADPLAAFPQKELVFADKFSASEKANLEEYFKSSLAERDETIKQLADWKAQYGNRPQYAAFEARAMKWLNAENDHLERIVRGAAGEGKIEAFSLGKMDPAEAAGMKMDAWAQLSKLRTTEEMSADAFSDLEKAREKFSAARQAAGNAPEVKTAPTLGNESFKPLDDAVSNSGPESMSAEANVESPTAPESSQIMTNAEAKTFDQPLKNPEMVKDLVEHEKYVNLRKVPSVSPEVLRAWQNEGNKTFNLVGLKPELLDQESALILRQFKGQVMLSDEVLTRMEALTSSQEAIPAAGEAVGQGAAETVNQTVDRLQPLAPEVIDNMNKELAGLDGVLNGGNYLKLLDPKAANQILEQFGENDARRNGIEMDMDKIKTIVLTMKNNDDPKMLAAMRQSLKNWIVGSENHYSKYVGGGKIYGEPLRRLAGLS